MQHKNRAAIKFLKPQNASEEKLHAVKIDCSWQHTHIQKKNTLLHAHTSSNHAQIMVQTFTIRLKCNRAHVSVLKLTFYPCRMCVCV